MSAHHPLAVIIGMPGAGKTRVGHQAASMLGVAFIDADQRVEDEARMGIPQYFERYGEKAFRDLESSLIRELLDGYDGLLSLGGGAPMTPATRQSLVDYVHGGGRLIYLQADPKEAMERARRGGNRPMLKGDPDARWKQLFEERDPVFSELANIHVRTHGSTPQMAARKLTEAIMQRTIHVTGSSIEPYDVRVG
ncbi:MAG: 3-dehydroquinate synthase, partial [Bifidobacterium tibiigranuli]|nr:3-dehydroquinate synthase [Bifidobacterium tibiigranuli]